MSERSLGDTGWCQQYRAPGSMVLRALSGGVAELAQASLLVQNLLSPLTAKHSLTGAGSSQVGPCFTLWKNS